jgi:hypothetical protein
LRFLFSAKHVSLAAPEGTMRPRQHETTDFCARPDQIINMQHELGRLAGRIDWDFIDGEIAPLYSEKGKPGVRRGLPSGCCCSCTFTGCPMKA